MIWIIGGTSDARKFIEKIDPSLKFLLTIATEGGRDFFQSENLYVGRMTRDEMLEFALDKKVETIVDLSHPYAKIVSKNAKWLSDKIGIRYIRYAREKTVIDEEVSYLNSYEECYNYLKNLRANVFFTTGSKNIKDFEKVKGRSRFIYRILPSRESLALAEEAKVHMRDIVAMLGPFSKDMNKEMFKHYEADYCILKDSGGPGGSLEKIQACKELGIEAVVIGREEEAGISDMDEILRILNS